VYNMGVNMATQTQLPISQMDLGRGILGGLDERERQPSDYSAEPIQENPKPWIGRLEVFTLARPVTEKAFKETVQLGKDSIDAAVGIWNEIAFSTKPEKPNPQQAQEQEKKAAQAALERKFNNELAQNQAQVRQQEEIKEDVRHETAGVSDEQKAKTLSLSSVFKTVSSIYHRMAFFMAKVFGTKEQEKTPPQIQAGRSTKMGKFSMGRGEFSKANEQAGGGHVLNTAG